MSSHLKRKFSDDPNATETDDDTESKLKIDDDDNDDEHINLTNSYHHNEMLPYVLTAILHNNILPELLNIIVQYAHIKDNDGLGIYVMSERMYDNERNKDEFYSAFYVLPTKRECYIKAIVKMIDERVDGDSEDIMKIIEKNAKNPISVILHQQIKTFKYQQKKAKNSAQYYYWARDAKQKMDKINNVLVGPQLPLAALKFWFDELNQMDERLGACCYEIEFKQEFD